VNALAVTTPGECGRLNTLTGAALLRFHQVLSERDVISCATPFRRRSHPARFGNDRNAAAATRLGENR
jgi:hypothetical protein